MDPWLWPKVCFLPYYINKKYEIFNQKLVENMNLKDTFFHFLVYYRIPWILSWQYAVHINKSPINLDFLPAFGILSIEWVSLSTQKLSAPMISATESTTYPPMLCISRTILTGFGSQRKRTTFEWSRDSIEGTTNVKSAFITYQHEPTRHWGSTYNHALISPSTICCFHCWNYGHHSASCPHKPATSASMSPATSIATSPSWWHHCLCHLMTSSNCHNFIDTWNLQIVAQSGI